MSEAVEIDCHQIRLGTCKFLPGGRVSFRNDGITFSLEGYDEQFSLDSSNIYWCKVNLGRRLPVLFFNLKSCLIRQIRSVYDVEEEHFSDIASSERNRCITMFPKKISLQDSVDIRWCFYYMEAMSDRLNDILIPIDSYDSIDLLYGESNAQSRSDTEGYSTGSETDPVINKSKQYRLQYQTLPTQRSYFQQSIQQLRPPGQSRCSQSDQCDLPKQQGSQYSKSDQCDSPKQQGSQSQSDQCDSPKQQGSQSQSDQCDSPKQQGSQSQSDQCDSPKQQGSQYSKSDQCDSPKPQGSQSQSDQCDSPKQQGSQSQSDQCDSPKQQGSQYSKSDQCDSPKPQGSQSQSDQCDSPKQQGSPSQSNQCESPKQQGSKYSKSDQCDSPKQQGSKYSKSDQCDSPKQQGSKYSESDQCDSPKQQGSQSQSDQCDSPKQQGSQYSKSDQCDSPKQQGSKYSKSDQCDSPKQQGSQYSKSDQCDSPKQQGSQSDQCDSPKQQGSQSQSDQCDSPKQQGSQCSQSDQCDSPEQQGSHYSQSYQCDSPKQQGSQSHPDQCDSPKQQGSKYTQSDQCDSPKQQGSKYSKSDQCDLPNQMDIRCYQIRIGLSKFGSAGPVSFSKRGIMFTLKGYARKFLLDPHIIYHCKANLEGKLPVLFFVFKSPFIPSIQQSFHLPEEDFNVVSASERIRCITMFLEAITVIEASFIKKCLDLMKGIYSCTNDMFIPIDVDDAIDILYGDTNIPSSMYAESCLFDSSSESPDSPQFLGLQQVTGLSYSPLDSSQDRYESGDWLGTPLHKFKSPEQQELQSQQPKSPKPQGLQSHELKSPNQQELQSHRFKSPEQQEQQSHQLESPKQQGLQSHQLESPEQQAQQSHQLESPKQQGLQSHQLESPEQQEQQSHQLESLKQQGLQSHQLESPKQQELQSHQLKLSKQLVLLSYQGKSPKQQGPQSHQLKSSNQQGPQSHNLESPKQQGMQFYHVELSEPQRPQLHQVKSSNQQELQSHRLESPKQQGLQSHELKLSKQLVLLSYQGKSSKQQGPQSHQLESPKQQEPQSHQLESPKQQELQSHQLESPEQQELQSYELKLSKQLVLLSYQGKSSKQQGLQSHQLESPKQQGLQSHQLKSPEQQGLQSHQLESPKQQGLQSHQLKSPKQQGLQSHQLKSPKQQGIIIQSHHSELSEQQGPQSHELESPKRQRPQSHEVKLSGQQGLQSHQVELPGEHSTLTVPSQPSVHEGKVEDHLKSNDERKDDAVQWGKKDCFWRLTEQLNLTQKETSPLQRDMELPMDISSDGTICLDESQGLLLDQSGLSREEDTCMIGVVEDKPNSNKEWKDNAEPQGQQDFFWRLTEQLKLTQKETSLQRETELTMEYQSTEREFNSTDIEQQLVQQMETEELHGTFMHQPKASELLVQKTSLTKNQMLQSQKQQTEQVQGVPMQQGQVLQQSGRHVASTKDLMYPAEQQVSVEQIDTSECQEPRDPRESISEHLRSPQEEQGQESPVSERPLSEQLESETQLVFKPLTASKPKLPSLEQRLQELFGCPKQQGQVHKQSDGPEQQSLASERPLTEQVESDAQQNIRSLQQRLVHLWDIPKQQGQVLQQGDASNNQTSSSDELVTSPELESIGEEQTEQVVTSPNSPQTETTKQKQRKTSEQLTSPENLTPEWQDSEEQTTECQEAREMSEHLGSPQEQYEDVSPLPKRVESETTECEQQSPVPKRPLTEESGPDEQQVPQASSTRKRKLPSLEERIQQLLHKKQRQVLQQSDGTWFEGCDNDIGSPPEVQIYPVSRQAIQQNMQIPSPENVGDLRDPSTNLEAGAKQRRRKKNSEPRCQLVPRPSYNDCLLDHFSMRRGSAEWNDNTSPEGNVQRDPEHLGSETMSGPTAQDQPSQTFPETLMRKELETTNQQKLTEDLNASLEEYALLDMLDGTSESEIVDISSESSDLEDCPNIRDMTSKEPQSATLDNILVVNGPQPSQSCPRGKRRSRALRVVLGKFPKNNEWQSTHEVRNELNELCTTMGSQSNYNDLQGQLRQQEQNQEAATSQMVPQDQSRDQLGQVNQLIDLLQQLLNGASQTQQGTGNITDSSSLEGQWPQQRSRPFEEGAQLQQHHGTSDKQHGSQVQETCPQKSRNKRNLEPSQHEQPPQKQIRSSEPQASQMQLSTPQAMNPTICADVLRNQTNADQLVGDNMNFLPFGGAISFRLTCTKLRLGSLQQLSGKPMCISASRESISIQFSVETLASKRHISVTLLDDQIMWAFICRERLLALFLIPDPATTTDLCKQCELPDGQDPTYDPMGNDQRRKHFVLFLKRETPCQLDNLFMLKRPGSADTSPYFIEMSSTECMSILMRIGGDTAVSDKSLPVQSKSAITDINRLPSKKGTLAELMTQAKSKRKKIESAQSRSQDDVACEGNDRPRSQGDVPRQRNDQSRSQSDVPRQRNDQSRSQGDVPRQRNDQSRSQGDVPRQRNDQSRSQGDVPRQGNDRSRSQGDVPRQRNDRSRSPRQRNDRSRSQSDLPRQRNDQSRSQGDVPRQRNDQSRSQGDVPWQGNYQWGSQGDVPWQGNDQLRSQCDVPLQVNYQWRSQGDVPWQGNDQLRSQCDVPWQGNYQWRSQGDVPWRRNDQLRSQCDVPWQGNYQWRSQGDVPWQGNYQWGSQGDVPWRRNDRWRSQGDVPWQGNYQWGSQGDVPWQGNDRWRSRGDVPRQRNDQSRSQGDVPWQGNYQWRSQGDVFWQGNDQSGSEGDVPWQGNDQSRSQGDVLRQRNDQSRSRNAIPRLGNAWFRGRPTSQVAVPRQGTSQSKSLGTDRPVPCVVLSETDGDKDSEDDVIVTSEEVPIKCPYTQQVMKDPVRNKICNHNYERDAILKFISLRRTSVSPRTFAKCPYSGCKNNKPLDQKDLVQNKNLKRYIQDIGHPGIHRQ